MDMLIKHMFNFLGRFDIQPKSGSKMVWRPNQLQLTGLRALPASSCPRTWTRVQLWTRPVGRVGFSIDVNLSCCCIHFTKFNLITDAVTCHRIFYIKGCKKYR